MGRQMSYKRPANCMHHEARLVLGGVDLPQFLHSDPIRHRLTVGTHVEVLVQRLGETAMTTLPEYRHLGV